MRIPLFRIWYSTTYTVLFALLLILLAASPADHVYQSIRRESIQDISQNISVVGGVYLLTLLVAIFIYSSRIYTNRTVLSGIPKAYIPIESGEVGKHVRRMIVRHFERSALIAWESRPRDLRLEVQEERTSVTRPSTTEKKNQKLVKRRSVFKDPPSMSISASSPPWGHITHSGWCSPASDDLPNLQYSNVVPELPNLIEAKAVSLAPPDPWTGLLGEDGQNQAVPDARVVSLLQRPPTMGLRDYLAHLTSLGLIQPPSLAPQFLSQYEHARFSTSALAEEEFRALMATFAQILSGMTELDTDLLAQMLALEDSSSEISSLSQEEAMTRRFYTPRNVTRPESLKTYSTESSTSHVSPVTARTGPSVRHRSRITSSSQRGVSPAASSISDGSVRIHPIARTQSDAVSFSSLSSSARSEGSVIRLSPHGDTSGLPYHIDFNGG